MKDTESNILSYHATFTCNSNDPICICVLCVECVHCTGKSYIYFFLTKIKTMESVVIVKNDLLLLEVVEEELITVLIN